ncbi:DNA polymerase III subunit delta [Segetibacter koreensis]|uniref:DNA polymerase III subunit delta n=1 Tax=Segetibacter koreensis TaxID=398037 RepID=UPI00037BFCA1|nr:DNA polymerase III subunit delta [Segetibacter koreensis]
MSLQSIISEWKSESFKSIYWLEGEEPYFIDKIVDYAEHHILNENEAAFNLTVFYGRDADWTAVVNACRRYPMFAERQVVLLKEAQYMKDIEKLEGYINKPLSSTVFVVAYKDKKVDGRTNLAKLLKKNAEVFSSKKIYESQLPEWTKNMILAKGFEITPQALLLLVENTGNDLSRLENEIEKVAINLVKTKTIDENAIEKYVGISKEFNAFELQAAIAKKDLAKAIRIIQYFQANPKAAPIQLILPAVYSYFSKVYTIFGMSDKSENAVKGIFSNNFYAAKEGIAAAKTYGIQGIEKVLLLLHEYNLRSIGINDTGTSDADLMKEMVVKMVS